MPGREAEPTAADADPARQLEADELVVAVEGPFDDKRLRVMSVAGLEADRHGLRAQHDVDRAFESAARAEATELALDDAGGCAAGQDVGLAEELRQPAR